MLSLTASHTHIRKSHYPFSRLNHRLTPSLIFECNSKKKGGNYKIGAVLYRSFGIKEAGRAGRFERNLDSSWCCWCKQSDWDVELDAEIMDFMAKSEKPTMFPTKEELMRAGRLDLVEAIKRRGGWYSFGWDEENAGDNVESTTDFDIGELQRRVESCKESASLREQYDDSLSGHHEDDVFSSQENFNYGNIDSLQFGASASLARSLDENTGIEGILSRLEKQRNSDFGIRLAKYGYEAHAKSKDEGDYKHFDSSFDVARTDFGENSGLPPDISHKSILETSNGTISKNTDPESWRTWSYRRAGFQHIEFEAAEISFSKNEVETDKESYNAGIAVTNEEYDEAQDELEEINHHEIRSHLQHLECELMAALRSFRSKKEEDISDEVNGSSSDLQKLSDAWEFQENEVMAAKDRLRSIKSKLAILEGKMALAITDSQKRVELKQKRIDSARKALHHIRTTCIIWPNSASEVLLAGSFDGWTTQRKMERSRTGIFSVSLKLYPGKYEIKFIVDGVWKVDPLRPIVNNNGYENNVLIVT